jgi:hypothetical protein
VPPSSQPDASAAVYCGTHGYLVHANSRTEDGVWVAALPARLLSPDADATGIGEAVVDALSHRGPTLPSLRPNDYAAVSEPVLRVAGARSWRVLQSSSSLCNVRASGGSVYVQPTRNGGSSGADRGYHPLVDEIISLAVADGPSAVGQAVLDALRRCK